MASLRHSAAPPTPMAAIASGVHPSCAAIAPRPSPAPSPARPLALAPNANVLSDSASASGSGDRQSTSDNEAEPHPPCRADGSVRLCPARRLCMMRVNTQSRHGAKVSWGRPSPMSAPRPSESASPGGGGGGGGDCERADVMPRIGLGSGPAPRASISSAAVAAERTIARTTAPSVEREEFISADSVTRARAAAAAAASPP